MIVGVRHSQRRMYALVAAVVMAVLGTGTAFAIRFDPNRHACKRMSADGANWQLNEMEPRVDTSSIRRAARRVHDDALRATNSRVRSAGVRLAQSLDAYARAARPFGAQTTAQRTNSYTAAMHNQAAYTNMLVACGLPTVDPED
jgi:hypothetical protein